MLSLRQLLLRLSALSREAAPLPTALVQPHDHADFSQVLLGAAAGCVAACHACRVVVQRC